MRVFPVSVLSIALMTSLLTGCGGGVELPVPGTDESITVEQDGDKVTYSDEESGTSVTAGEGVEVPESFPSDFPLPDQATILSTVENQEVVAVFMEWDGMTRDGLAAYIDTVKAAGYNQETQAFDMDLGDGAFNTTVSLSNGQTEVLVVGTSDDSASMGQVSLTVMPSTE